MSLSDFYDLVFPLVPPSKFCIDPEIKIDRIHNWSKCTSKHIAGIKYNKITGKATTFTNAKNNTYNYDFYPTLLVIIVICLIYIVLRT